MKIVHVVIITFLLFSCKIQPKNEVHPFQRMDSYNGNFDLPINERFLDTPSEIIYYLNGLDNVENYSSHRLLETQKKLFIEYFEFLPIIYKEIITEKVFGIYFVNNFKGGGMTLPIFDNNGTMNLVFFFNPEIFRQNITEWINYRDNSAFINNFDNISITVECDDNYYAIIHTLVHEASHAYDYYNYITPFTERFLENKQTKFPTDFVKGIWKNYDEPNTEYNFVNRENIFSYDLGERIDKKFALEIYKSLRNTPFSSIYGSKTWAEDFAESFTWYYLKKYFDINYITKVTENRNLIIIYNPLENEMVKSRFNIFEKIVE